MTLALDDRQLLLDAVRPPAGMRLDAAVGTTFTLDLLALLAVPVSAAFRRMAEPDAGEQEDIDVIESVRQSADKTLIFCQTGLIALPRKYRPALVWTEPSVIEVRRPQKERLFHPKVWAFRFVGQEGVFHHRVLVMSRNMTFDRSWDILARFDEEDGVGPTVKTDELTRFLRSLPGLARTELDTRQATLLASLTHTLASAPLALPDGFTRGEFCFIDGSPGHKRPFLRRCDNALAVCPFLGPQALQDFSSTGAMWRGVVSRRAALDTNFDADGSVTAYELKPTFEAAVTSEEDIGLEEPHHSGLPAAPSLRGLHAKLYVQDKGNTSSMWLGSANLTTAAFTGNVEMLVRLDSPTKHSSVDGLMGWNSTKATTNHLAHLVTEYTPGESDVIDFEEGLDELGDVQIDFGEAHPVVTLKFDGSTGTFSATLKITHLPILPAGVDLAVRLASTPTHWQPLHGGSATWASLPLTRITPFVGIRLKRGATERTFLVKAELKGDPSNRRSAVLASCIRNRQDFFRYLASLLGYDTGVAPGAGSPNGAGGHWVAGIREDRVLDDLLATASRDPRRLQYLDSLLDELDKSQQGKAVVPPEFIDLWEAVRPAVRKRWQKGS